MTAIDTLTAISAGAPQIPRFDDGMVNVQELILLTAESLVNEIVDAQAEDACADGNQTTATGSTHPSPAWAP